MVTLPSQPSSLLSPTATSSSRDHFLGPLQKLLPWPDLIPVPSTLHRAARTPYLKSQVACHSPSGALSAVLRSKPHRLPTARFPDPASSPAAPALPSVFREQLTAEAALGLPHLTSLLGTPSPRFSQILYIFPGPVQVSPARSFP